MTPYEVYWQESGEVATCKPLVPKIEKGGTWQIFATMGRETPLRFPAHASTSGIHLN
tara:strand:+ start:113 stop:283 length:171 start_codon:yes stop_codon:yes gene_type:complete